MYGTVACHRIIEQFGLEETLIPIQSQPSAMGRAAPHQPRLPRAPFSPESSRDGALTASLSIKGEASYLYLYDFRMMIADHTPKLALHLLIPETSKRRKINLSFIVSPR